MSLLSRPRRRRRCSLAVTIRGVVRPLLLLLLLSLLPGAPGVSAQGGSPEVEPKRPAYQIGSAGRFNEDWSVLRGVDVSTTDDFWDRVKFIPLTPDQSVWLTLGGQVRERFEYFHQFLFGASQPKQSDGYLLSRYRLVADLHVTRYFRMFAEGKSSLSTDRDLQGGQTTSFVDEADLLNGFADVFVPFGESASLTLRGGRQELIFGSQRLVGPGDFTQIPRAFEGGSGILRIADWAITPFWTEPVQFLHKYRFNESHSDLKFYGIFASGPAYLLPVNLDLYWLGVDNSEASFNGTSGREQRQTLGGRVSGKVGATGLDAEVEGAAQFGTVGRRNIAASMSTVVLGYTLPVALSPRVYVEFDYASGSKKPRGEVGTFSQLFPNAHSYLGYIDYIGRQNILSSSAGVSVTPIRDLTLSLQQYFFWRASDRDALYNKSAAVLRPGTGTRARYVGAELDLYATYNVTRHLLGYAGYSRFFTGDFIRKTGPDKDSDFWYVALQYTF